MFSFGLKFGPRNRIMKKYLLLATLLVHVYAFNQEDYFLTPQDKAYLYHTVRKSPILELNIGHYIVYTGPEVLLPNGKPYYDSIEQIIINQPELLIIYSDEVRKAPKGILAEAANKQAIWELNKVLHSKRSNSLAKDGLTSAYEDFEQLLLKYLPEVAIKTKKEGVYPHPKLDQVLHPSLAFNEKNAVLQGFSRWTIEERKQVLEAFNSSINQWVEKRTYELFTKLGGEASVFTNILTAAGDGSMTSGMFEEREKDEAGRWNKGLPKAVGLFPYNPVIVKDEKHKKERKVLTPQRYSNKIFHTVGQGKQTNIHLDVWGYNSEKQTTVVIEKAGKSYPLFGSTQTRFLSPDSTFTGEGGTYYTVIHKLEADIERIEELISGKKGYDYWIDFYDKRKRSKYLKIDKLEKELSDLRYQTITTKEIVKRNKKELRVESNQKKRYPKQDAVVRYYEEVAQIKKKIAELEKEKEEAIYKKDVLIQQLKHMKDLIGRNWVPFEEEEGLYTFEDGATFDLYTQEFMFPPSKNSEPFEIRLIAIPYSHTSDEVDEVMLHINITDAFPNYDAKIQVELLDVFSSNSYTLQNSLFEEKDSVSLKLFFDALLDRKKEFNMIVRGAGVGQWNGFKTVPNREAEELLNYPGSSEEERLINRNDSLFMRLRTSQLAINIGRSIDFELNSYTDPIKTSFTAPSEKIARKVSSYRLSGNDVLSAYRSFAILTALKNELSIWASKYLSREDAQRVIDRFNKEFARARISVGATSFKIKDFEY